MPKPGAKPAAPKSAKFELDLSLPVSKKLVVLDSAVRSFARDSVASDGTE